MREPVLSPRTTTADKELTDAVHSRRKLVEESNTELDREVARRDPTRSVRRRLDQDQLDLDFDVEGDSEAPMPVTDKNIRALGLQPFRVIRSTIRDSLRRYVSAKDATTTGVNPSGISASLINGTGDDNVDSTDVAWLNKVDATRYLDLNFIRVELPDNFGGAFGDATVGSGIV